MPSSLLINMRMRLFCMAEILKQAPKKSPESLKPIVAPFLGTYNIQYTLERIMNVTGDTWSAMVVDLGSRPPENTYTDTLPSMTSTCFYRVWVRHTNA